uniref:non-specific serine/threonine protein kinase n=1 Tax=Kalanchoe fedtschenkoi TaxID=63787 RepID=A0A7N0VE53_KALFE
MLFSYCKFEFCRLFRLELFREMEGSSRSVGRRRSGYSLRKIIGRGGFAEVKLAVHTLTGVEVAIKIIPRKLAPESAKTVKREINILRLLVHPHIVRLYEVVVTPTEIHLVMELMKNGELYNYVVQHGGRLGEDEARRFFQQIISGVDWCHRNRIVHRDLKLENLLLDRHNNVKITDFGLSNVMRDGRFLKESCGSRDYAAPEIISGTPYAGPEVDVWSCGVILYTLLCGAFPFFGENPTIIDMKIKKGVYKCPSHMSPGAMDLISRILVVDPIARITMPEIRQHPWFQQHLLPSASPLSSSLPPSVNLIDEATVQKVVDLGFKAKTVIESLQASVQNKATVSYFLLLDTDNQAIRTSPQNNLLQMDAVDHPGVYFRAPPAVPQKWILGIQSVPAPSGRMAELLRILQELNVRWKKIGNYNIKCLWLHQISACSEPNTSYTYISSETSAQHSLKFEIQMYKGQEDKYLLDLQKVSGPSLLFLEICFSLAGRLLPQNLASLV